MAILKLTETKSSIVDDDLFDFLSQWHWTFDGRYASRVVQKNGVRKKIYLHKFINQTSEGKDTDHINGNKLDNRRINLRDATRGENCVNRGKYANKTSKYKGVSWFKLRGKWRAEIKLGGVKKHLGLFVNEEEAALAYDRAVSEHFGAFAKLNLKEYL